MNILPQNIFNHIQPNRNLQSGFPVYSPVGGAEPVQDTFSPGGLPSPDSGPKPESYGPAGSAIYGNIHLDLYFGRAEYQRTDITRQGPDGAQTLRQELYRRFEAGLSLDFSFMARFDGAAEKMSQLDTSVFDKWMKTAGDLLNLKEEDFEEFVKATDELFNEIEKVLGMGPDDLDYIADFFSSQVDSFLDDVKEKIDYFDSHPLGEGEDLGLGIPGLLEAAKNAIPENLKQFLDELMAKLQGGLFDEIKSAGILELLEYFRKEQMEFFERLREGEDEGPEENEAADDESEKLPGGEEKIQPFSRYILQRVFYMKQVYAASASFNFGQLPDSSGAENGRPPVDVTA